MKRAIFLDKDGTLIKDVPYNVDPEKIELLPGVVEGLLELQEAGYLLIGVSNQSGLARGMFTEEDLEKALLNLTTRLAEHRIELTGFYFCPHHSDGSIEKYKKTCSCRKPMPGLLQKAAEEHNIDLKTSWMIGDILNDVEAGHKAGCKAILINNGNETEWILTKDRLPDFSAESLQEAAEFILYEDPINLPSTGGQIYG